jgi:HKD family nuclease
MIVQFIGQGIHENEDETCGNYICSSIKDDSFTDITIFVAFLRFPGLNELKPFIEKAIEESREITIFVGIDERITSKEALELLLKLGVSTYVYNSEKFIYHPKIYLFESKTRNRIIVGSSNLTKAGLFYNVESSILLDFMSQDKSGLKILNQLKDYYSSFLDYTDPNIETLSQDYIDQLLSEGKISRESYDNQGEFISSIHDKSKAKGKNPEIGKLGDLEVLEYKPSKNYYSQTLKITEEYLAKWDLMFERMRNYKEKFGSCTVKREYKDRTLYGWYRKQKLLYNDKEIVMPKEHIDKLRSIGFYFGDGHILHQEKIVKDWLEILFDAILNNEKIGVNHRYKYNGLTLGTWLVGISQANKKGKKLDVRKQIEDLGFNFSDSIISPENIVDKYVSDLLSAINPDKQRFRTRFNQTIKPKKKKLSSERITQIDEAWQLQFNEELIWAKINEPTIDRTEEWKEHRKNEGVWHPIKLYGTKNIKLYHWVKNKRIYKKQMNRIKSNFTEHEIIELRNAGFPI